MPTAAGLAVRSVSALLDLDAGHERPRHTAELPNRKLADDMQDLQDPNRFGCMANLLYADYVESAHLTDVALAMNRALDKPAERKANNGRS